MRIVGVVAVSAALVVALAGCTLFPSALSSSSASGTASAAPSASPTLSPTPVAALPLSCAQLFTIGAVQSHLDEPVSAKVDETHPGPRLLDLAVLQAGGTECTWGGTGMTDASYDTGVTLAILPDAAAAFARRNVPGGGTPVTNTIGTDSSYICEEQSDGDNGYCSGDLLAGTYWVEFTVHGAAPGDTGDALTEAIMTPIAAAVASAGGAVSNWARPASAFDGAAFCTGAGAPALVASVLGGTATLAQPDDAYADLTTEAGSRAGVVQCSWQAGHNTLGVQVLPEGSWAFPALVAAPPLWTLIGHPTPIQLSNAVGALAGCGDSCQALVSTHRSLVQLDVSGDVTEPAAAQKTYQSLISAIPAS